jgi:glycosyltransferase involved in cell wall biosynthesis
MTLVSIIMPTYNARNWVGDTIDNIIAQTYSDIELVVVDDGSSDDTVSVVREKLRKDYKKSWQIVELGANQGPSAARNVGLRAATGSWVQYLDSDDLMATTKLERQMAYCAQASSEVAHVHSPWRMCYIDAGEVTFAGGLAEPREKISAPVMCLVGGDRPLHNAGLTRRSVLDRIGGFDESLRFWECEEVNVRIAKAGRIELVPSSEPVYLWRMHRGKIYIGGTEARYRSAPVALSWMEQILKAADHLPMDRLGLTAAERTTLLDDCTTWARLLYSQDRAAFRKYLAMARQFVPDIAPAYPKYASVMSRYVGYESAEGIAKLGRMPKTMVRKALERLQLRPKSAVFDWN